MSYPSLENEVKADTDASCQISEKKDKLVRKFTSPQTQIGQLKEASML